MQIPVLIEPVAGNGYRAKGGEPFPFAVEGATREEALQNLRQKIANHLSTGGEIVSLEIQPSEHPLAGFAGMFKDDPLFDEVKEIMAENRRLAEQDPDY